MTPKTKVQISFERYRSMSLGCSRDRKQFFGFDQNWPLTNARTFCIAVDPATHVDPKDARERKRG